MINCEKFVEGYMDGIHLQMNKNSFEWILSVSGFNIPSLVVSSSFIFHNVKLKIVKRQLIFTSDNSETLIHLCFDSHHALSDYRLRVCNNCKIREIRCMHCDPKNKNCELIPTCNVIYCYNCLTKDDEPFSWAVKRMLLLGHNARKQGNGCVISRLPLDILKEIFDFVEKSPRKYIDPVCRKSRYFCSDAKCKEGYAYVQKTLDTNSKLVDLIDVNLSEKCKCCISEREKEIHRLCLASWEQERCDVYRPTKSQKTNL